MNLNLLKNINSLEPKNIELNNKKEGNSINNEDSFRNILEKGKEASKKIEKKDSFNENTINELNKDTLEKEVDIFLDNKVILDSLESIKDSDLKEAVMSILSLYSLIQTLVKDFKGLENGSESLTDFNFKLENIKLNLDLLKRELEKTSNFLDNSLIKNNKKINFKLLEGLKEKLSKEDFSNIEKLILKLDIDFRDLKENSFESLLKGLINIKNYDVKDENLIKIYEKDNLKNILLNIDNNVKKDEKHISLKEVIKGLDYLNNLSDKKEGIENLREIKSNFNEEKPLDIKIKGKEEGLISEKNEDDILASILDKNENKSLFNRSLEVLNKAIKGDEPVVIRKSNINTDLIKSIKYMNINGVKELTVKVYPRDLGEIIINISKDEEVLKATLKANSKDTFNLISQNSSEIKKLLLENGLKISNVDISLYEDTTFYNENEFNKNSRENKEDSNFNYENEDLDLEEIKENEEDILLNTLA
ncbi:flagellar hook-length control protein FliK [uncultured Clostridium sp.]|uniref:flagellar hook-length control protein FliK n=1 Tax=uncultured Clostridium sp. TaxID=59620 RepID=UPI00258968CE|nr:flagellar hook-length control protein FliK [uncultured Clostridium sp.]